MKRHLTGLVVALTAALALPAAATAAWTNCSVNASGGYANCLNFDNPRAEQVKAYHTAGLPYRFQLVRFSTGSIWGWWEYSDLNYHQFGLDVSGTITAQVDNRGTANPAAYYVEMVR